MITRRWARWLSLLGVCAAACEGRPPLDLGLEKKEEHAYKENHIVSFDVSGGLPEVDTDSGFFNFEGGRTYTNLVLAAQRAQKDEHVKGFLLRMGTMHPPWAQAEQLGALFKEIRSAGKPTYCHADSYNSAGLWFALQACDKTYVSPAGGVDTVGLAAQMVYLKRLLERFHVQADFLHMGRYKSAAETLTREGPSDDARESLLHVLTSLRQTWISGLTEARPKIPAAELAEDGPWGSLRAVELGLVDATGYEDDALEHLQELIGVTAVESGFSSAKEGRAEQIAKVIRAFAGASEDPDTNPRIIVLPTAGSISMKPSGALFSSGIAASSLNKTIRRLAKNDAVKAVVLRIDSPGGSALASDLIWRELIELKKRKPLIVSIGDMAASGGYFMACPADVIVAAKTSIVGSIGVVGGKIVLGQAFAEYGADTVTISPAGTEQAQARAAYMSALSTWDEPTRVRVGDQMREIYELFLRRVADGRSLPIEEVRKMAEGRIWSGEQGKELKLVDEIGDLARAIALAKEHAKVDDDITVEIEGGPESLLDMLLLDEDADAAKVRRAVELFQARQAGFLKLLPRGAESYVSGLQPLLDGEKVLAVMPFALHVD